MKRKNGIILLLILMAMVATVHTTGYAAINQEVFNVGVEEPITAELIFSSGEESVPPESRIVNKYRISNSVKREYSLNYGGVLHYYNNSSVKPSASWGWEQKEDIPGVTITYELTDESGQTIPLEQENEIIIPSYGNQTLTITVWFKGDVSPGKWSYILLIQRSEVPAMG